MLIPDIGRSGWSIELHVTAAAHGTQGGLADLESFAELQGRQPPLLRKAGIRIRSSSPGWRL